MQNKKLNGNFFLIQLSLRCVITHLQLKIRKGQEDQVDLMVASNITGLSI